MDYNICENQDVQKGRFVMFGEKRDKLTMIPLDRVTPGSAQPRKRFDESELAELTDSIRQHGVLQPILVRKRGTGYELIAGERRVRAAKAAGLREIPALVRPLSDDDAATAALLENLQRSDLSFFEEAEGIAALIRATGMTQEQAAARLGKQQSTVANKLRLLRYSEAERAEILNGGLTERHARCLLAEPDAERRMALIRRAAAQRLNVSQTEKLIAAAHKPKPHRAFIAKDIRLFLNTINHAVRVMNDAGVGAQQEQTESAQFMEIRIRIPKSAAPCVSRETSRTTA